MIAASNICVQSINAHCGCGFTVYYENRGIDTNHRSRGFIDDQAVVSGRGKRGVGQPVGGEPGPYLNNTSVSQRYFLRVRRIVHASSRCMSIEVWRVHPRGRPLDQIFADQAYHSPVSSVHSQLTSTRQSLRTATIVRLVCPSTQPSLFKAGFFALTHNGYVWMWICLARFGHADPVGSSRGASACQQPNATSTLGITIPREQASYATLNPPPDEGCSCYSFMCYSCNM